MPRSYGCLSSYRVIGFTCNTIPHFIDIIGISAGSQMDNLNYKTKLSNYSMNMITPELVNDTRTYPIPHIASNIWIGLNGN